jgi:uncharacterized SAM-binding protein YcdF (DUF218 family)
MPVARRFGRLASLFVLSAGLAAWTIGLLRFAATIPHVVEDAETPTEAIVVLTGGSERFTTGLRLLAQDKAGRMFVSGVHPDVDVGQLLVVAGEPSPDLAERIETGHAALDTAGNAAETAGWMQRRGYHSLRLVTSHYHMPRSLAEFRRALPEVRVIPHPVFSSSAAKTAWWQRPATIALVISEYNKYLLSWLVVRSERPPLAVAKGGGA